MFTSSLSLLPVHCTFALNPSEPHLHIPHLDIYTSILLISTCYLHLSHTTIPASLFIHGAFEFLSISFASCTVSYLYPFLCLK